MPSKRTIPTAPELLKQADAEMRREGFKGVLAVVQVMVEAGFARRDALYFCAVYMASYPPPVEPVG